MIIIFTKLERVDLLLSQKKCGFTLIEILIVISIIGLLAVLGIPAYDKISQRSESKIVATQLMRAIQLARAVAITQGVKVQLCGSDDQLTCSNNWRKSYILLIDNKVEFVFSMAGKRGILYWRSFPSYLKNLEFLPSGRSNFQNGTFRYCFLHHESPDWAVVLNQAGRARLVYPNEKNIVTAKPHGS